MRAFRRPCLDTIDRRLEQPRSGPPRDDHDIAHLHLATHLLERGLLATDKHQRPSHNPPARLHVAACGLIALCWRRTMLERVFCGGCGAGLALANGMGEGSAVERPPFAPGWRRLCKRPVSVGSRQRPGQNNFARFLARIPKPRLLAPHSDSIPAACVRFARGHPDF